jgi:hypothetical protein
MAQAARVSPTWLALRETADAAARSVELVETVHELLAPDVVIHDLGCGTGSMGRWLSPRLGGQQHWIMHDRDGDLLARAAAGMPPGTVTTRRDDITRLTPPDLAGAGLVTASALLDMLTAAELERIVAACVGAHCPALFMLTVVGQVNLHPVEPLDARVTRAFNGHQRRTTEGRTLLGPDAVDATVDAFARRGWTAIVRASPWRLGPAEADLAREWFAGWVGAAIEHEPPLAGPVEAYRQRRLAQIAEGQLSVTVGHQDVFAWSE